MKRVGVAVGIALAWCAVTAATAPAAFAAKLCVGHRAECSHDLQGAVDAAQDGDTIVIDPGVHPGGIQVDVSVRLVGAGAASTIIRGGGPVLTIGAFGATSEPTVSISGVTISGGVTRASDLSSSFFDGDGRLIALGGGIEVPPAKDLTTGATLTISDSVIAGNRVAPAETRPIGPDCPDGPCPFAAAEGGGIDNWGTTRLARTVVAGNAVGSATGVSTLASDANGGGIANQRPGTLTLTGSAVRGNRATATAPNGRFADSGAIFSEGALDIDDSSITGNAAELDAALPSAVDLLAIAGAIHVTGSGSATVRRTTIARNRVRATNTVGDATAFSGGFHADVDVALSDDTIASNRVDVATRPGSHGNAHGDSGAGELSGTITATRFVANGVSVTSVAGSAEAVAGSVIFGGSLRDSIVAGNRIVARSPAGAATARGGGLQTGGVLDVRRTVILRNRAAASGARGAAEGGGISNTLLPDGPPLGLALTDSAVTANTVYGSPGVTRRGGGIFSAEPVTLARTPVEHNRPDQCVGC